MCEGFLNDNNRRVDRSVNKLTDFTKLLTDHSDDIEQVLHVTPNGLANFYNIYNPAQGTVAGLLSLPNFANPVQFICGGIFDDRCRPGQLQARRDLPRNAWVRCCAGITMNFPPLLFHPINSITAYKGQIIYDTPAHRGEGADAGALSAVAVRARCDASRCSRPATSLGRSGAAAARRAGPGFGPGRLTWPGPAHFPDRRSRPRPPSAARVRRWRMTRFRANPLIT